MNYYVDLPNGKRKVIGIISPENFASELAIYCGFTIANCEIISNSLLLVIPMEKAKFLNDNFHDFSKMLIETLTQKLIYCIDSIKSISGMKLNKQLAQILLRNSEIFGKDQEEGWKELTLKITINYLADMIATNRETVSRILKELHQKNLIKYVDKVIWVNTSLLKEYIEN